MRHLGWILVALCAVSVPAAGQSCADTSSTRAQLLLRRVRTVVSEASEPYASYRATIMNINLVPANQVSFVTVESTCHAAKLAYEGAVTPNAPHAVRVLVLTVGADYLVVDPQEVFAGRIIGHVFSANWQRKTATELAI